MKLTLAFSGDNSDWDSEELETYLQSTTESDAKGIRSVHRKQEESPQGSLGSLSLDILTLVLGNGFVLATVKLVYEYLKDRKPTSTIKVEIHDGKVKLTEATLSGKNQETLMKDLQTFITNINDFEYPDQSEEGV